MRDLTKFSPSLIIFLPGFSHKPREGEEGARATTTRKVVIQVRVRIVARKGDRPMAIIRRERRGARLPVIVQGATLDELKAGLRREITQPAETEQLELPLVH